MQSAALFLSLILVHSAMAQPGGPPPLPLPPAGPESAAPPALPSAQPAPAPAPSPRVVPGVSLRPQDKLGRTYSEGSAFNIWGGNREQRANLFTAAGLVRRAMLDALHLPDRWHHPIVIQIREPLAHGTDDRPPVWTTVSQVEGGFRIEINLVPRRNSVPGPLLQENLVRALLADQVLQGKENYDLAGAPVPPPDWLLHGTLALLEYRQLGRMSQTFSRIFQLGRILSVQDILNADPEGLDSVSMTIYRVSCGALLMMLIEQPKGGDQLAQLLPTLAGGGQDHALLIERAYPSLTGSSNSLSKWWSLQVAALSQPGLEEIQRPLETGRQLTEALVLRYTAPPAPETKKGNALQRLFSRNKPAAAAPAVTADPSTPSSASTAEQSLDIAEFARLLPLPDSERAFNQAELALTRLMLRAHPIYRPIILEYQEILRGLAKKKPGKNLPSTLARLATTRQNLAATLQSIEDHLDWHEATQTTQPSGEFEGYLQAAEAAETPPPRRTDPLSRYLDEMEKELSR